MPEHNTTLQLLSQEFMFDIVRRAFNLPTSDTVLVLRGAQGCGKSRFVQALAKDWKMSVLVAKQVRGNENLSDCKFVEITDFANLKPKDLDKIKHLVTNPINSQVTFVGTTNVTPDPDVNKDDKKIRN